MVLYFMSVSQWYYILCQSVSDIVFYKSVSGIVFYVSQSVVLSVILCQSVSGIVLYFFMCQSVSSSQSVVVLYSM